MENNIQDELNKIVASFEQLPYLFVGTGLSMRYASAPSWNELLKTLWKTTYEKNEDKDYELFKMKVASQLNLHPMQSDGQKYVLNPEIAKIISDDFNNNFFSNINFRERIFSPEDIEEIISYSHDPFKFCIAKFIHTIAIKDKEPSAVELDLLKNNANKIAGIITTNYDNILESIFPDFNVLIGQEDLLVANTNNIFEIFKIHGCSTSPNSLVITRKDYEIFMEKLKYLSAKLLTIFVEHPIIFIGYGLGDINIQRILEEVCNCLNHEQMARMNQNFIFVNPATEKDEQGIKSQDFIFNGNRISMTEITLIDYSMLYNSLTAIKSTIPVKLIRKLQDMVCNFVYSTNKTNNVVFGNIDSPDIDEDKAALYVGPMETVSALGFASYDIMEIIEDVIFDNKPFLMQKDLINKTFPNIRARSGAIYLPPYKYLTGLNLSVDDLNPKLNIIKDYKDLPLTSTDTACTKNSPIFMYISDIEQNFQDNIPKQFSHIFANKEIISSEDLGEYLRKMFGSEYLKKPINFSNFKKLGVLYDFKKYCLKE